MRLKHASIPRHQRLRSHLYYDTTRFLCTKVLNSVQVLEYESQTLQHVRGSAVGCAWEENNIRDGPLLTMTHFSTFSCNLGFQSSCLLRLLLVLLLIRLRRRLRCQTQITIHVTVEAQMKLKPRNQWTLPHVQHQMPRSLLTFCTIFNRSLRFGAIFATSEPGFCNPCKFLFLIMPIPLTMLRLRQGAHERVCACVYDCGQSVLYGFSPPAVSRSPRPPPFCRNPTPAQGPWLSAMVVPAEHTLSISIGHFLQADTSLDAGEIGESALADAHTATSWGFSVA
eukprot:6183722-Pyramimonas_sp.AAC.1